MLIGHFVGCLISATLCLAPSEPPAMIAAPQLATLLDPYHRTVDVRTTAIAYHDGGIWGLYVDDTVPDGLTEECQIVASDLARGWHRVIAGISMGATKSRCPGAINAVEWYPFGKFSRYVPPPPAPSYILQWGFHWPGKPAPTRRQRLRLLRDAEGHHPRIILLYSGS